MESGKQGGIQLLLAAEQESQSIVNASKNDKMTRMKQAKLEAGKDISDFRAQVEADFQRKVAERLEIETEEKTNTLTSESSRISTEVVQMLMRHVLSVKT